MFYSNQVPATPSTGLGGVKLEQNLRVRRDIRSGLITKQLHFQVSKQIHKEIDTIKLITKLGAEFRSFAMQACILPLHSEACGSREASQPRGVGTDTSAPGLDGQVQTMAGGVGGRACLGEDESPRAHLLRRF